MSKIYLASPYGFAESTKPFLQALKSSLTSAGFEVLDPWDVGAEALGSMMMKGISESTTASSTLRLLNERLAQLNRRGIDDCDIVVAGLDGSDVDSGTASEIGYAFARGKRVVGLRTDLRRSGENSAARVNMQVQYWIEESGGTIVSTISELVQSIVGASLGRSIPRGKTDHREARTLQT